LKNLKITLLGVIAVAALIWSVKTFFAGDETQIRKQIEKLEKTVSFDAEDGNIETMSKVRTLQSLFTEDVNIEFKGDYGGSRQIEGRKEVQQSALAARAQAEALEASLHDLVITLTEDASGAVVEATGRARIPGENQEFFQELVLTWVKIEGEWLISEVRTIEALR
jgi:hypothetical protein